MLIIRKTYSNFERKYYFRYPFLSGYIHDLHVGVSESITLKDDLQYLTRDRYIRKYISRVRI